MGSEAAARLGRDAGWLDGCTASLAGSPRSGPAFWSPEAEAEGVARGGKGGPGWVLCMMVYVPRHRLPNGQAQLGGSNPCRDLCRLHLSRMRFAIPFSLVRGYMGQGLRTPPHSLLL